MPLPSLLQSHHLSAWLLRLSFCLILSFAFGAAALACSEAQELEADIAGKVQINAEQLVSFQALPRLRVLTLNAPPMVQYNERQHSHTGIAIDIFCFIADQLNLNYQFIDTDLSVTESIQAVQDRQADVFIPLSLTEERGQKGIFTLPYFDSHYAVIARKGWMAPIRGLEDLAPYSIGVISGSAIQPVLDSHPSTSRLQYFNQSSSDSILKALRDKKIDVALLNKNIFTEQKYRQEYFDLESIHTLRDYPRSYRFYFSKTPEFEQLAQAFDQYLAVIDVNQIAWKHEDGERQFLERYAEQRTQQKLLQFASGAAVLLALIFYLGIRRYRHLAEQLAESHELSLKQQEELKTAYAELEQQNQTDALTRLANRRHFDKTLSLEHTRHLRTGSPLSVLLIDVDYFKLINDHYGHAAGDNYLQAVGSVLQESAVRPTDLPARYGGDEFACILPDTSPIGAYTVSQRIAQGIAKLELPNNAAATQNLTVSIGVATLLANSNASPQDLLASADAQLYAAKHAGRNRIVTTILGDETETS